MVTMTTKPQKIEGGWVEKLRKIVKQELASVGVLVVHWGWGKEDLKKPINILEENLRKLISQEIEKAVASERQRCVEALPSEIGVRRGRDNLYDTPMGMMDMTDGEVEAFNQAIDQAKHKLEQLK